LVEQKAKEASAVPKLEAGKGAPKVLAGRVPFPRTPLKEALKVSEAIWKNNAGQPFDPILLAQTLGTTNRSSWFSTLLLSSERYGLTVGGVFARAISMTETAQAIVAPTDESKIGVSLRDALTKPKVFNQFFTKYDRKNIPREDIVKTVLERESGVPRADVEACYKVIMQNITDYGLSLKSGDSTLLYLDKLGKSAPATPRPLEVSSPVEEASALSEPLPQEQPLAPIPQAIVKTPKVFISHSKNKSILAQIKQMLDFGKFESVIAEEKETTAMPLSEKVFDLMWDCNCAIINISADSDKKQDEAFDISDNVIAELWGAYLHYRKKVILVIDKRQKDKLPSIMQGLTAIYYTGDELSWGDGMRLQKALTEFRSQL
jgi:predicted nucleotide-binding protein